MTNTYALTANGGVVRSPDGLYIPPDPANNDYRIYLASATTNPATPYVAPAQIFSCQLWQLQSVMSDAQWTQIQTAVTTLANPAVSAFFAHGTNMIPSNSTTLLALGETIGLTAVQIATLVQVASGISIP